MTDTLDFSPTLRNSWLVQRLQKPFATEGAMERIIDCFSFGGGLKNGGISQDGMKLFKNVFRFDYMGSSEFEWGIVPSCLYFLASNTKHLVTGSVEVAEGKPQVYFLCHKVHANQVPNRIRELAKEPGSKERVGLIDHFQPCRWRVSAVGWLDCSNGFMFFVDKEMFEKTCTLFGVTVKNENTNQTSH